MKVMKSITAVMAALPLFTFIGCSETPKSTEMTARVRITDGGPQIFVNDKAVPPRMFWGRSGARTYPAPANLWGQVSLDFSPLVDTDRATVHVRFKVSENGTIKLRNFHLFEDGKEISSKFPGAFENETTFKTAWNIWDPQKANFVRTVEGGVCSLTFHLPKDQRVKTQYHFYSQYFSAKHGKNYCVKFEVQGGGNSTAILPNVYNVSMSGHHDSMVSGNKANTLYSTAAKAAAAGVDFVSYGIPDGIWGENGDDFSQFDAITRQLIAVNPKVRLIPRVSVNAPLWWLKKNPDHRMAMAVKQVDAANKNKSHQVWSRKSRPDMATVSSRLYREDATAYITRFCQHMMTTFPENFAGIHPTGQNTHEWFYFDSWTKMNGYDLQTLAAFRAYMKDQKVRVPSEDERMANSEKNHLLDANTQRLCIEFNRFQQLEMTDFVAQLARACRAATDGKKLVLFFYGYAYEFSSHTFGPANSGHYGIENLIKKSDGAIDILCSPISYGDRHWPGAAQNMSCGETIMRHGILWLNEDDSRTYLDMRGEDYVGEGSLVNEDQSCKVMLRNTSTEAVHGFGSWWMDLPGWGWYDSELLWSVQQKLNPLDESVCRRRVPFTPEVALIQDEESMIHVRPHSQFINGKLVANARKSVNRAGVSHGQYLLFDVLANPIAAKLQIFQSCWCLSDTDVAGLLRQKRENPAWRVWCWAAGAQDERGKPNLSRMSRLTGFQLAPHDLKADSRLVAKPTPVGISHKLVNGRWYGSTRGASMAFKVTDAKPDEIWATYPNGDAAIVVRANANGGDIFLGVPELAAELVHAFAEVAGVHTYIDRSVVNKVTTQIAPGAFGDPKGGFGMVQAQQDVDFNLRLHNKAKVVDALTGAPLGMGDTIPLKLKQGEVVVFRYER